MIRQEHIDITEEGVEYNVIKYNGLGKAEFLIPNLDITDMVTWFAVEKFSPVILEVPTGERYALPIEMMV